MKPPPHIINALKAKRVFIQNALQEALEHSIIAVDQITPRPRSLEIAYLAKFFIDGLPRLQNTLNSELHGAGVNISIKGVFCHKNGALGPVVDFEPTGVPRGCELADLLVLTTYDVARGKDDFGNGVFLQAKLDSINGSDGSSTARQRQLYQSAERFVFRRPDLYADSETGDHKTPGTRMMPGNGSSGFCFWEFNPIRAASDKVPWSWHASSVYDRNSLVDPFKARSFGEAMFDLMAGEFGEGLGVFHRGKFDWNRIAHDVIRRALVEPVGPGTGIVDAECVQRLLDGGHITLEQAMASPVAIKHNPFHSLLAGIADESILPKLSKADNGLTEEAYNSKVSNLVPPTGAPPEDNSSEGSSGSFIVFELSKFDKATHR